ncbi:MAG: nucleotidyltransferase family protein [Clostridia bacterium]|nr:nucleotidyltransferase family protein [Clostridia bacterium]
MNNTESALLALLKTALFGAPSELPEDLDWAALLAEAKAQTVVPLVFSALPKEQAAAWLSDASQAKAHFMRALYEQTKLVSLFEKEGIPFVILKGCAAAIYYPTPSARTMGDVDILVGKGSFDRAFALLKENGYKYNTDYGDGRDYSFLSGGVVFELHKRYSDERNDIEEILQNGIEKAETATLYGNAFPMLPKAVNGLVLLDHIRHHLYGGLGIRQIIDFMLFVHSIPEEGEFAASYLPLFESCGLGRLARVVTKMCKTDFGLPTPCAWCDDADDATAKELLETLLAGGNFGRKDPYEYKPMRELSIGIKQNGFFRTLQKAGVANCKAFQKHKILRPFAWIYQLFRYAGKGIASLFRGEKLRKEADEGKEKADFYRRLGI